MSQVGTFSLLQTQGWLTVATRPLLAFGGVAWNFLTASLAFKNKHKEGDIKKIPRIFPQDF